MTQITSLELYYRFVAIIDQATADEDIYAVPRAAEAAGMVGGEDRSGRKGRRIRASAARLSRRRLIGLYRPGAFGADPRSI